MTKVKWDGKYTKVKTVSKVQGRQESWVSEYPTREEAEAYIRTALKWGIGIISCKIIEEK